MWIDVVDIYHVFGWIIDVDDIYHVFGWIVDVDCCG